MSVGTKKRGWQNGDPLGSEKPRGKDRSQRKSRFDKGFTPTEQRTKAKLMRQFLKGGDGPRGNSDEYRNASCWCPTPGCTRLRAERSKHCANHELQDIFRSNAEKLEREMASQFPRRRR